MCTAAYIFIEDHMFPYIAGCEPLI